MPKSALARFQSILTITRDVSFKILVATTIQQLQTDISDIDKIIKEVTLVDFFQKPEWQDKKSVTLRIVMQDPHATLESATADAVMNKVTKRLASFRCGDSMKKTVFSPIAEWHTSFCDRSSSKNVGARFRHPASV